MDELGYTTRIKDSMNFLYPSKTKQNAKFVYTKLGDISLGGYNKMGVKNG